MVKIDFTDFLDIMTTKMSQRDNQEELEKGFILFGQNKDHVSFQDLRRIANELGENMSDEQLKEMMYEANKTDRDGVVTHEDFMNILNSKEK